MWFIGAIVGALLGAPVAAGAEERLADFPYRAPVATPGSASHYRFALPATVYRGAARRDLGDLRLFNAAGEPLPYAFVPREAQKPEPRLEAAPLFPLYGDPAKGLESTAVRVDRNAKGTVVSVTVQNGAPRRRALIGYLLDASAIERPLDALLLDWGAAEPFTAQARVEASDDLRAWSTLVAASPVLYLEHDGARLERRRIDLPGARARYLRLSFTGVPSAFQLTRARFELHPEKPDLEREWQGLDGTETRQPGEWRYDSGGHFPADRARLRLPQPNTVVQVRLFTRSRADDPWRPAGAAVAYRLSGAAGEISSPEIALRSGADRYWLVRVDSKGGGIGAGELGLDIGWVPHEIVFAARGRAPFVLAYGDAAAGAGSLPLAAVLPRRADGAEAASPAPAKVGPPSANLPVPPTLFGDPLRYARSMLDDRDASKWLLWAVLVAGVALLAWMALRLLHEMGRGEGRR